MKRNLGFLLSLVEAYSFLGFIAALIALIAFRIPISDLYNGFCMHNSFTYIFFSYMFLALFLYPISMILSVICEMTGWLYDGQYRGMTVWYAITFNIWNDLIFPRYAIENRQNAPKSATFNLILWVLIVIFLVLGFCFTILL